MRWYIIVSMLLVLLIFLYASGCKQQLVKQDVIGTWEGTNGSVITFTSNHFYAKRLPEYAILYSAIVPSKRLCSGDGRWKIRDGNIDITFKPIVNDANGQILEREINKVIYIRHDGANSYISFDYGDPDDMNRFLLKRKE